MGFSVLYFDQLLHVAGMTATFDCTATIVWQLTPDGWRKARWHVSILSADVPEELATATGYPIPKDLVGVADGYLIACPRRAVRITA